ncbi:putative set domain-containing protein [Lyophyllum shimeji]|uniref:Set domain-containing protein n=1 Tax=Lyophyllum shimeji TaxID=47721 RepID=A0A9P3PR90_LYOSH|nr:putative set domain-containing protein [Lyophyllum shimeji]
MFKQGTKYLRRHPASVNSEESGVRKVLSSIDDYLGVIRKALAKPALERELAALAKEERNHRERVKAVIGERTEEASDAKVAGEENGQLSTSRESSDALLNRLFMPSEGEYSASSSDDDGRNLWEASDTPEESFSGAEGADANGYWEVEIIGEEVDGQGQVRYEAAWKNWTRADGTNTTWDNQLLHEDDIKQWKRQQTARRNKLAQESLDIDLWDSLDIHNTATYLRQQAYEEKLRIRLRNPVQYRQKMEKLLAKRRGVTEDPDAPKPSSTRSGRLFARESSTSTSASHAESSRASGSSTTAYDSPSSSNPGSSAPKPSSTRSGRHFTREIPVSTSAWHSRASGGPSTTAYDRPSSSRTRTESELRASTSSSTTKIGSKRAAPSLSPTASRALKRSATASGSAYELTPSSSFTSAPSSSRSKGKQRVIYPPSRSPTPTDDDDEIKSRPVRVTRCRTQRTSPVKRSRRERLETDWTAAAHASGAAGISIVNDVDDEDGPPLPPRFRYIESEYRYSNKVERIDEAAYFVRCECERECTKAVWCECQGESGVVDKRGNKTFAYTTDGLFRFNVPQGVEVIECNPYCHCERNTCPNRVAQRPRDVPVEIFKTDDRGWGVRSCVDVERGKVLGIYTGRLIPRAEAEAFSDEERSFCFDLDGRESRDGAAPEEMYTVDSRTCGNWTRFLNHSCSPNLAVYNVVYDTIPELNMPYIAFVAKVDIPAGTEFTFDYDPAAAALQEVQQGKGKGRRKRVIPDGAKECRCGSDECRGWVRV